MELTFNRRLNLSSVVTDICARSSTRFAITFSCRASFARSPRSTCGSPTLRRVFAISEAIKQVVNAFCGFRSGGGIGLFLGICGFFAAAAALASVSAFALASAAACFFASAAASFLASSAAFFASSAACFLASSAAFLASAAACFSLQLRPVSSPLLPLS